ncbi:MAG: hypothetical protein A2186_02255 [Candidatus Levybacteria bacterium RIFOXYA1_FULL_41_10]|nr:MAG: Type 4 prepilin-like protein leader peptide-processing enzyme [Candidatus Levybacteria bacterium GW2011_GWA1_39_34]KKR50148.1 MAG: Type 4 prepilin-like protein leader peptide-processing enzyme [Candidatus Levybacteria bacterium GW2011_GWC1_40_19]KKR71710.1 MAG: Type 4 prepilin-like protein leader peptide-processing enzyme [Candidatus Levybacteria bacterium GW2011_GWC2_40_7]KKR94994.1 MAG: Type 4 prepilin-like protein leader peptide-processing enzyme [Candidatus Levybacteria bacterium GW2
MLISFIAFFLIGLILGSFLNVLIDRVPRGESIFGRSYCETCRSVLGWRDLIPVLSFASLFAKCRYCGAPLSYFYPVVEIVTGATFAGIYYFVWTNFQMTLIPSLLFYLVLSSSFVVIFFSDLRYGLIPDKIVFPTLAFVIVYISLFAKTDFVLSLLSAVGLFIFFFIIFLATRGKGIGLGDLKFSLLMGFSLGFPHTLVGIYLAFLTGGISAIILVLWGKKRLRKDTIPFGPFLVLGTLLSIFFGDMIVKASTRFFGI